LGVSENQPSPLSPQKRSSFCSHVFLFGVWWGEIPYSCIFLQFEWRGYHVRPPLWNKGFGCAPLGRRSTPCPRPTAGGWVGILRDLRVVSQCFTHVFLFLNSLRKDGDKWKPVVFGDAVCFPHIFLSGFSLFSASFWGLLYIQSW
jgi:hypothetical protein